MTHPQTFLATTKKCSFCKKTKSLSEYNIDRRTPLGVASRCRKCHRKWQKENYEKRKNDSNFRKNKKRLNAEYTRRLRQSALDAYGGVCACCGESRYEFLGIDHINGGGKEDRRKNGAGHGWYLLLKRNNYPQGEYRVLCHNCNLSYGFYGFCPHQTEKNRK